MGRALGVSILRSAVLSTTNGTDPGEECEMSTTAEISEPASELERLIADLSGSGLQGVFAFGVDCRIAPLAGVTAPVFRGPADRRSWHVVLGDDAASWTMDVRVGEVTGVRFARRPSLFRGRGRRF